MNVKRKALTVAVAAAMTAGVGTASASDVLFFPYVVNSESVTTIVSVIDRGVPGTARYNASGQAAVDGNRLHYHLTYKAGDSAGDNAALCDEINYFLPTSPNDIQTIDLGAHFGGDNYGVLFGDASNNNNYRGALEGSNLTYALAAVAGTPLRGNLVVNNAASATPQASLEGEAMVFEFATGAAWGYKAFIQGDSGRTLAAGGSRASDFDFSFAASADQAVTFMPLTESRTVFIVTPVNDRGAAGQAFPTPVIPAEQVTNSMLGADGGASVLGWNSLTTRIDLWASATGVAFDRDENAISGSRTADVTCVGAVNIQDLMTAGAQRVVENTGGWTNVRTRMPSNLTGGRVPTRNAVVIKLEFNTAGVFNGQSLASASAFNNAFVLPSRRGLVFGEGVLPGVPGIPGGS
ncbi:hypothetical protein [Thiorhodospira sibirica]|uniref:hypothetical protein n=1 Tax=Thiorhodospira sibirica TaxID=154347 RepID=UPI00022C3A05|nr:hypothetical protein [Thiorhodospira sibirica]